MGFTLVTSSEVKLPETNKYSELHDAIEAMPLYSGDEGAKDVLLVSCATEAEQRNTRNSVRSFTKKKGYHVRMAKTEKEFDFTVKKFRSEPKNGQKP